MRALEVAWAWESTCDVWLKSNLIVELVSFPLVRLGPTYVTSIAHNPRSLANNVAVIRPRKQHVVNYFFGLMCFNDLRRQGTTHSPVTPQIIFKLENFGLRSAEAGRCQYRDCWDETPLAYRENIRHQATVGTLVLIAFENHSARFDGTAWL